MVLRFNRCVCFCVSGIVGWVGNDVDVVEKGVDVVGGCVWVLVDFDLFDVF